MIDWDAPLEAYHDDGEVAPIAYTHPHGNEFWQRISTLFGREVWLSDRGDICHGRFGDMDGWHIRNIPSPVDTAAPKHNWTWLSRPMTGEHASINTSGTIPINRDLWERVEALVRSLAVAPFCNAHKEQAQARAIVAMMPHTVDPDLLEARQIVAECCKWFTGNKKQAEEMALNIIGGVWDDARSGLVQHALAAIRKGRKLERGNG